jgi:transcriptional regulator with XRE-family HTH domain
VRQLAEWRKRKSLTQVELAKLADCDQSTISAIERGAAPSAKLLARLVEVLGVPSDDLKAALLEIAAEQPAP